MVNSIYWLTQENQSFENGVGYAHHNKMMRRATEKHIDINDPFAKVFLQIVPADQYRHAENKYNVLFTMWEFPQVPESYKENLGKADLVLVPCKFCQDIFAPYTKRKPLIVNEGIDSKDFPFYQRHAPKADEKFRVFWSGARNPRKGYHYAVSLSNLIKDMPDVELYIKTHAHLPSKEDMFEQIKQLNNNIDVDKFLDTYVSTEEVRVLGKHNNIMFDMRKVPFDELREMYNKAHLFLFPTNGEGWGLMGSEALATGCPVLATNVTGVKDWFGADVGYCLDWEFKTIKATNYDNMPVSTYSPKMASVIEKFLYIKDNYDKALELGKRGSKRMHKSFRWEQQGIRLFKILEKLAI